MPQYSAFGIDLWSDIELPELRLSGFTRTAELRIVRTGSSQAQQLEGDEPEIVLEPNCIQLAFHGVGRFRIWSQSNIIEVSPEPDAEHLVRYPLLGPVIAIYLHLQGRLVLHASAVTFGDSVVAFLGDKGAGKSTTAAAAMIVGAALFTDDLLVCSASAPGTASAERGFSQIKLNADAAAAMSPVHGDPVESPHPRFTKTIFRILQEDSGSRILSAICILERAERPSCRLLNSTEALAALLRYTYVYKYGGLFLSGEMGAENFRRCAALLAGTQIFSLSLPEDLTTLPRTLQRFASKLIPGVES